MATYYEVTLIGEIASQQVINRLNFTSNIDDVEVVSAYDLGIALGLDSAGPDGPPLSSSVLSAWLAAQTTAYALNEIMIRNLFSVTDFYTLPLGGADWLGTIAVPSGDRIPTFVASKLQTNRIRTDVRRGSLALTGGTEEQIEGADQWTSAYMTLLNAVAAELNAPPSRTDGSLTALYRPSVFGKEKYAVPGSDPVRYAYRYYTDETEFAQHAAVGVTWTALSDVTSQVTRKIGRGA